MKAMAVEDPQGAPPATGGHVSAPREVAASRCFLAVYLGRLRGAGETGPPALALSLDLLPTFVFSTGIMLLLAVVDEYGLGQYGLQLYLPSFWASCALTVCLITAPGAQPKSLLGAHLLAALFGVCFGHATGSLAQPIGQLLAGAFAVALLTPACLLFGWLQPSSSATAVLAVFHKQGRMHDAGYIFLVTPVLLGGLIVFACSWLMNNLIPWRPSYPLCW
ncbi:HPP family protein [Trypanosoma conorhini]|uniref:HPP family protein n=1 Tax=Trypanosoma conorhini TaxID=83891 RepID=A0A3R7MDK4_9TRYP|nr:HPP family protein [Trypanosoma conorhini]RNF00620.1 HPP family protein [Trypanosoma conorhini]